MYRQLELRFDDKIVGTRVCIPVWHISYNMVRNHLDVSPAEYNMLMGTIIFFRADNTGSGDKGNPDATWDTVLHTKSNFGIQMDDLCGSGHLDGRCPAGYGVWALRYTIDEMRQFIV